MSQCKELIEDIGKYYENNHSQTSPIEIQLLFQLIDYIDIEMK